MLKTQSYYDANFAVIGGNESCPYNNLHCCQWWQSWHIWELSGGWFNIKMTSYQYRKSHCGDKTILQPSYFHNGISYTGKTTSLYWIRALISMNVLGDTVSYQTINMILYVLFKYKNDSSALLFSYVCCYGFVTCMRVLIVAVWSFVFLNGMTVLLKVYPGWFTKHGQICASWLLTQYYKHLNNSLGPSMNVHQSIKASLVLVIACCKFGAKLN